MAFKHLGAPYGWGGMENSVDCSSLAQDVYRTVGIELPRNGDEQARALGGRNLRGLSHDQKMAVIGSAAPGSILFTPYHVMLVLGNYQGTPYMIHSLASYGQPTASPGGEKPGDAGGGQPGGPVGRQRQSAGEPDDGNGYRPVKAIEKTRAVPGGAIMEL